MTKIKAGVCVLTELQSRIVCFDNWRLNVLSLLFAFRDLSIPLITSFIEISRKACRQTVNSKSAKLFMHYKGCCIFMSLKKLWQWCRLWMCSLPTWDWWEVKRLWILRLCSFMQLSRIFLWTLWTGWWQKLFLKLIKIDENESWLHLASSWILRLCLDFQESPFELFEPPKLRSWRQTPIGLESFKISRETYPRYIKQSFTFRQSASEF